jgi:hypothetical protein|nr:MAG TPA: hypothetical protein [Caudoviricetes sp.]DAO49339.1 MAG TPA: hypothetical protein [Caudoviricetes sp.]DAQ26513.1 MAG TPA: hypothetical protein [Caudoviricetes sp.]DAU27627.1 MAG TPA: hypothetical protein [Caudoviricetes sp.]DAV44484.1 MAG TPA: hypothetical protein [Caudoviricetes sp.]
MGRLIDAEELKERFCEENCGKNRCVDHMDKCAWILSVEESKTAFDVDKVVEQLKTKKARTAALQKASEYFEGETDAFEVAIKIVKDGES